MIFPNQSYDSATPLLKFLIHRIFPAIPGAFSPENLRESLHQSLKALGPHKIRTFYLHFPDRSKESASAGDILREVNELSKAGHL